MTIFTNASRMYSMSDSFAPDFNDIPASDAEAAERWLRGTYMSGWSDLRMAAYSSALAASVATQRMLGMVESVVSKAESRTEATFVLSMNHRIQVLGPALGAVVTAAFAAESFTRLVFTVGVELDEGRSRELRGRGYSDSIGKRLADFDAMRADQRIAAATELALAKVPSRYRRALGELIEFRNELAHDGPVLFEKSGDPVKAPRARGAPGRKAKSAFGPFSALRTSDRSVRLEHARAAIDAHDSFTTALLETARRPALREGVLQVSLYRQYRIRDAGVSDGWYETLCRLADHWERKVEPTLGIDEAELANLRANVKRKASIRRVK